MGGSNASSGNTLNEEAYSFNVRQFLQAPAGC